MAGGTRLHGFLISFFKYSSYIASTKLSFSDLFLKKYVNKTFIYRVQQSLSSNVESLIRYDEKFTQRTEH